MSATDKILDLDEMLASPPRLAERIAWFPTKPDLEADLEDLEKQLAEAAEDGDQEQAVTLAKQLDEVRAEMRASFRSVRLRQLNGDDWDAFRKKWKLATRETPAPIDMWDDLLASCAVEPAMSLEQVKALATKIGDPPLDLVRTVAWDVNTKSGASMPRGSDLALTLARLAAAPSPDSDSDSE